MTTTVERPYGLTSLTERLVRLGRVPRPPVVGCGPRGVQPHGRPAARRDRVPRRTRATCRRSSATRPRTASASHPSAPATTRAHRLARRTSSSSKTDRLDTVELDAAALSGPRRCRRQVGVRRPARRRSSDSPRCTARLPTSSIVGYGARRRSRLVRAQARPVHEQHHRHRARHRRRPAARVDADNEPELFWALRGGGGSFGVVTALEFRLFPIAEVYAGALFFPWERSAEVLHAWRDWIETVPDEVTSVGRILQFPPLEDVPVAFRGQGVRGRRTSTRSAGGGGRRAARAAAGARPRDRHRPHGRPRSSSRRCTWTRPTRCRTSVSTSSSAICRTTRSTRSSTAAGPGSGSRLVSAEIRHVGGALGRGGDGNGALDRLPGDVPLLRHRPRFGRGRGGGDEARASTA